MISQEEMTATADRRPRARPRKRIGGATARQHLHESCWQVRIVLTQPADPVFRDQPNPERRVLGV